MASTVVAPTVKLRSESQGTQAVLARVPGLIYGVTVEM